MSNVINLFSSESKTVNPTIEGEYIPASSINPDIVETQEVQSNFNTFEITEEPILRPNGQEIPKRKALFVGDNNINIVSKNYKIVQPKQVIETFENTTGLTIDGVVNNPHTGGLLLKSRLENHKSFNGDDHHIDLSFYTGHNGQYRTLLSLQACRHLCMNQVPALSANNGLWLMSEKHYQSFSFKKLKEIIETLPLHMANFQNDYNRLGDIKLTKKDFLEMFASQYKIQTDTKAGDKRISKISDVYSFAQGQESITNDSAYKAYNAITYANTHLGRNGVNKLEKDNIGNMSDSHKFFTELLAIA